jgi:hypothetical protein
MFGHDDKKDEDRHEEDGGTDSNSVVSPVQASDNDWQHPGPPPADDMTANDGDETTKTEDFTAGHEETHEDTNDAADVPVDPANDRPDPAPLHTLSASDSATNPVLDDSSDDSSSDDLIDLKQEALGKLSPLIDHLDQSPDEKFRTLMMMIQASDDQSLIRQAYEAAQQIDDEKTRAQALLDIVNEINYFTQNPKSE